MNFLSICTFLFLKGCQEAIPWFDGPSRVLPLAVYYEDKHIATLRTCSDIFAVFREKNEKNLSVVQPQGRSNRKMLRKCAFQTIVVIPGAAAVPGAKGFEVRSEQPLVSCSKCQICHFDGANRLTKEPL